MTDKPLPLDPKAAKEYLEAVEPYLSNNPRVNVIEAFMAGQEEAAEEIARLEGVIAEISDLGDGKYSKFADDRLVDILNYLDDVKKASE